MSQAAQERRREKPLWQVIRVLTAFRRDDDRKEQWAEVCGKANKGGRDVKELRESNGLCQWTAINGEFWILGVFRWRNSEKLMKIRCFVEMKTVTLEFEYSGLFWTDDSGWVPCAPECFEQTTLDSFLLSWLWIVFRDFNSFERKWTVSKKIWRL